MNQKITAITVCYNYSDYLRYSIEANSGYFDDWIIVTTPCDSETINLCNNHNRVRCITSDSLIKDVPEPWTFSKTRANQIALENVRFHEWILMLDTDSYLPPNFRVNLNLEKLNIEYLYGAERIHAGHWFDINRVILSQEIDKGITYEEDVPTHQVISGFFQLFHWNSEAFIERDRTYVDWPPLGYEDRLFSNVWRKSTWKTDPDGPLDRDKARLLNNLIVVDIGANNQQDHKKRTSQKRKLLDSFIIKGNEAYWKLLMLKVFTSFGRFANRVFRKLYVF
jgi:hypothetical protein